jgi:hypothetical protein
MKLFAYEISLIAISNLILTFVCPSPPNTQTTCPDGSQPDANGNCLPTTGTLTPIRSLHLLN